MCNNIKISNTHFINTFQGLSYHELCQQYPDIINKLHALDAEICGGTTATVVLIYNNKLYMANVGRSLLHV